MLPNRSIPRCTVIPQIGYPDVTQASEWLCNAFGFTVRVQIGNHRVQLNAGDGALVVTEAPPNAAARSSVMIRVDNVDDHHARAAAAGARILRPPTDHPYGERQYTAEDPAGHSWTFTQSIADVAPEEWGGTSVSVQTPPDPEGAAAAAQRLARAIGQRDINAIRSLLAPGFVHRAHGGDVSDAETFLRAIAQIPGEIISVTLEQLDIDLCPSGALVTGVQHAQVRIDGEVVDDRRRFVDWFSYGAGAWRIFAAVDFPMPASVQSR